MGNLKEDNKAEYNLTVGSLTVLHGLEGPGVTTIKRQLEALQNGIHSVSEKTNEYWRDIAKDNVVTPTEKAALKREYNSLSQTYTAIINAATAKGYTSKVEITDLQTAYSNLTIYLYDTIRVFDDMSNNTELPDVNTFNYKFGDYYSKEYIAQSLLNQGNNGGYQVFEFAEGTLRTYPTDDTKWYDAPPAISAGKYLWFRTAFRTADGNLGTWVYTRIQGDAGTGIASVTEHYLASTQNTGVTKDTAGWTTTIQQPTAAKKYLWNYETITYDDTSTADTTPTVIGTYGIGIKSIAEKYLATTEKTGITKSTTGWTTTIQTVSVTKKYLWNYEIVTYEDNTTSETDPVIIGVYGDTGKTGTGISSVTEHYLASNKSSGVTKSTTGWTTTVQNPTVDKRYLWNYETITYDNNTTYDTSPAIIGVYGETGKTGTSITGVSEKYIATTLSVGVTKQTAGWTTTIQSITAVNKYLWNYEIITYSDGETTETEPVIIGVWGNTGTGISSVTEHYLASSEKTGVTIQTAGWTTSIQTLTEEKKYLWNYETINYDDNTNANTAPVIIGVYGETGNDGVSITGVSEKYLATTENEGVTKSTSGWTDDIQTVDRLKRYLWNYEIIHYDNDTTSETDPVIIGVYGDSGPQVKALYSEDGESNWHAVFDPYNDRYMKLSYDDGETYTKPMKMIGEDGQGSYTGPAATASEVPTAKEGTFFLCVGENILVDSVIKVNGNRLLVNGSYLTVKKHLEYGKIYFSYNETWVKVEDQNNWRYVLAVNDLIKYKIAISPELQERLEKLAADAAEGAIGDVTERVGDLETAIENIHTPVYLGESAETEPEAQEGDFYTYTGDGSVYPERKKSYIYRYSKTEAGTLAWEELSQTDINNYEYYMKAFPSVMNAKKSELNTDYFATVFAEALIGNSAFLKKLCTQLIELYEDENGNAGILRSHNYNTPTILNLSVTIEGPFITIKTIDNKTEILNMAKPYYYYNYAFGTAKDTPEIWNTIPNEIDLTGHETEYLWIRENYLRFETTTTYYTYQVQKTIYHGFQIDTDGNADFRNNTNIGGETTIGGNTTIGGTTKIEGDTTISGNCDIGGDSTFRGKLDGVSGSFGDFSVETREITLQRNITLGSNKPHSVWVFFRERGFPQDGNIYPVGQFIKLSNGTTTLVMEGNDGTNDFTDKSYYIQYPVMDSKNIPLFVTLDENKVEQRRWDINSVYKTPTLSKAYINEEEERVVINASNLPEYKPTESGILYIDSNTVKRS